MLVLRIRDTDGLWRGLCPRLIPTLARGFHFGIDFPDCSELSSAKAGQPKVWWCFRLGDTDAPVNISIGDRPC